MTRLLTAMIALVAFYGQARAQISGGVVKIGVLTDMAGPWAAWAGPGSVIATRMAVEDFTKKNGPLPFRVEVVAGDFQLKADIATSIARDWMRNGVDVIVDVPQSGAALAVNSLLRGSSTAFLATGAQHDDLTTTECSPNTVHWTFDSSSLTVPLIQKGPRGGQNTWFFLTVDLAGGKGMEAVARDAIDAAGGRTVGAVHTPVNSSDFSSFLLQAKASDARTIGVIQGGGDLTTALKQANEFGMMSGSQTFAATFVQLSDVHALGLDVAKGLRFMEAFYWDVDDKKRTFAAAFASRSDGRYPTSVQAGAYSAVFDYLKAVVAAGSDDGPTVVSKMKTLRVDDGLFGPGEVRQDGRMVHDMFFVEAKNPAQSVGPWDLYRVLDRIPAKHAFRPMSAQCHLVGIEQTFQKE